MSARFGLSLGLMIAAVAVGGWGCSPVADSASSGVGSGVSTMISATMEAYFTGAQASLDAQRTATGTYAGAVVQPPVTLVRADAMSYCLQLDQGAVLQHLDGPAGTPAPGAC